MLQVLKLSTALASLVTCIQDHVSSHYSDLLSRAVASSDLESSLGVMATHIGSLQMSTDRLRARVSDPYVLRQDRRGHGLTVPPAGDHGHSAVTTNIL